MNVGKISVINSRNKIFFLTGDLAIPVIMMPKHNLTFYNEARTQQLFVVFFAFNNICCYTLNMYY